MGFVRMTQDHQDVVWSTAWQWVQREHDREHFDDAARAGLVEWLSADASHRKAYDKASRLWLLAGLVPPANDIGDPPDNAA